MTITQLIKGSIANTNQISRIYFCGNNTIWKIGETAQPVSQRMSEIRKTDKDVKWHTYFEFNGDRNLRQLIEVTLKMALVSNGYENVGNDHFIIKGEFEDFENCFIEAVTTMLNGLRINYTIRHNEKMG